MPAAQLDKKIRCIGRQAGSLRRLVRKREAYTTCFANLKLTPLKFKGS